MKKQIKHDIIFVSKNGISLIKVDNKYGYIDKEEKLICPIIYDNGYSFYRNFGRVSINGKYALMNKKGEIITEFKYNNIWVNSFGCPLIADVDGKWGILSQTGKELTPMIYTASELHKRYLILKRKQKIESLYVN